MCASDVEHLLHVFFDCDFASQCWQKVGIIQDMWGVEHAPSWLLDTLSTDSHERLIKIATVLWGIWFFRNKRVWENKVVNPGYAMDWSTKQVAEWAEIRARGQAKNQGGTDMAQRSDSKWSVPAPGYLKVNVDASVFPGASSFSIGMTLRNHDGEFIGGRVLKMEGVVSVFEAEVVGVHEALSWIDDNPTHDICIETDSLLAFQAINNGSDNQLEVGNIIESCRLKLACRSGRSIRHIRKLANRAAHLMARVPCMLNSYNDFLSPPQFMLETLMYDVSS